MNPRIIHTRMNTIFIFPIASFRKTLCSTTAQCNATVAICLMHIGKITKKLYFLCKTSLDEPAFVKMTNYNVHLFFCKQTFPLGYHGNINSFIVNGSQNETSCQIIIANIFLPSPLCHEL